MGLIESMVRWALPAPAAHVLDVAEEMPAAVAAFTGAWNRGAGPIVALREFAAHTDNALDDEAVEQLEAWLRWAIARLDQACAGGAWLSEREASIRGGVDAIFAVAFGAAFQTAAWRDMLRAWSGPSER